MRNGRYVLDKGNFQSRGLKGADSGFSAGAGTLYIYLDRLKTVFPRCCRGCLGSGLSRERSGLSGTSEIKSAGARP